MQIERNLYPGLRSKIERSVERPAESSTSKVLVDKEKGQKNQQNLGKEEDKEKQNQELAEVKDLVKSEMEVQPVLIRRLDLVV